MVKATPLAIDIHNLSLWYGDFQALFEVDLQVKQGLITALIGPSGCGKSTLLRAVNRINERLGNYVRTTGEIHVLDQDILRNDIELAQLRRHVGMVFQRPNPLPLSVRDNVLFAHRIHRADEKFNRREEDEIVENALRRVLLWDEVKDHLGRANDPEVILMDEPTSALDPKGTAALEELIWELHGDYTILIVTHNMAQAKRASEETAFMLLGRMVEHGLTEQVFLAPREKETADYIEGRYG